jgi:hypothetical protein
LVIFLAWIVREYSIAYHESQRMRAMSQISSALEAYQQSSVDHQWPADVAQRFDSKTQQRYIWLSTTHPPSADSVILIERPEQLTGAWCFALYGDYHVEKLHTQAASDLIRQNASPQATP